jgi:peptidoglycan hydrolase CwlO-like protein
MSEELVKRLRNGVPADGLHEDNNTELFDIEDANEAMSEAADAIEALQAALAARDGEIEALHKRIVEQRDEIIRLDLDLCEISKGEDW